MKRGEVLREDAPEFVAGSTGGTGFFLGGETPVGAEVSASNGDTKSNLVFVPADDALSGSDVASGDAWRAGGDVVRGTDPNAGGEGVR